MAALGQLRHLGLDGNAFDADLPLKHLIQFGDIPAALALSMGPGAGTAIQREDDSRRRRMALSKVRPFGSSHL